MIIISNTLFDCHWNSIAILILCNMAKTRSKTRQESLKSTEMPKRPTKMFSRKLKAMQTCRVLLTRLSPNEINVWLHGQAKNRTDTCVPKKEYQLRKRAPTAIIPKSAPKSLLQLVSASKMALHTAKAIRIWENLKRQNDIKNMKLELDQIVCARMSGHRPWPSKIVAFQKNGIKLTFFGTHDTGIVKKSEVIPFELCADVLEQYLKVPATDVSNKSLYYHLSFIKACKEINIGNGEAHM